MNGLRAIGLTVMLLASAGPALAQLPGEPRPPFQYDATGDAKYNFQRGAPDERVRDAQRVLQERGFYHGPLDGLMTPEMRRSVWNFCGIEIQMIAPSSSAANSKELVSAANTSTISGLVK